ncbi:hypothetical protein AB0D94_19725 [Streptomyces sp. NPDC048255]|uniref:hypothetical protein n=1 Tax=Streptomyces sp. NPDC048255 TaxID=3154713 RepID=UPI0033EFDB97
MRPTRPVSRIGRALMACAASAAAATVGLAVSPAAAAPAKSATTTQVKPGDACTAADLGTRRPYITTTEVTPAITHVKGRYITEGTTGYGGLNCNRVQQGDGSWALKWIEGPGSGSLTTTLEEGAVRCEDKLPAGSITGKAQDLLDCGSAAAKAEQPAGAVAPTAKQMQDRPVQRPALTSGTSAEQPKATGRSVQAALNCETGAYKIAVPGKPLSWGAPLLAADGVRLRPSTIFSAHLDHWRLCNVTETNGVLEASLWNWGNGGCATIAEQNAATERAVLTTVPCTEDDLQRFYIYRDVPGSSKIGVQNKYTGSMMGHDRYADGEFIRQYSSGRQDGTGTYALIGV